MPAENHRLGFTISELMIVVVILAILASGASFTVQTMVGRIRLNNAAEEVRGLLVTARTYARSEAVRCGVHFDKGSNQAQVFLDISTGPSGGGKYDAGDTPHGAPAILPSGVVYDNKTDKNHNVLFGPHKRAIVFFGTGSADSAAVDGNVVVLENEGSGEKRHIRVEPLTGKVTVE